MEWLRELWRPRQPQSQTPEAEVVPFPAARASDVARETDRKTPEPPEPRHIVLSPEARPSGYE